VTSPCFFLAAVWKYDCLEFVGLGALTEHFVDAFGVTEENTEA
jgi:hypothetical protein